MRSEKRHAAFTLIELMIVVCIIGVLASVALPTYQKFIMESKGAEGVMTVSQLYKGAAAYWEMPSATQGIAATSAGHCLVVGDSDAQTEAGAGMPPMPPTPQKRSVEYSHNEIFAALGFSRADAVYFVAFPLTEATRGACDPTDGIVYYFLAASDLDGDGMLGGYYLPVFVRGDEIYRSPGYKGVENFMFEAFGAGCPQCAGGID